MSVVTELFRSEEKWDIKLRGLHIRYESQKGQDRI